MKRKRDRHLPPRCYRKHGAYWHVRGGKWTRLGAELRDALAAYAAIYETPAGGMSELIDQALAHIAPKLKPATRSQYAHAGRKLKKMLVEFSPEQVKPKHVVGIKIQLAATPNMANRVLSLLRQVFDYALELQLIESNPAVGVKRHAEPKRTRLLTVQEYEAIYAQAVPRLQVTMDLLRLTGQRIGDVLRIRRADLIDEGIRFQQQKTGAKLIVRWTPELRAVVDRAKSLHGNIRALTLLHNRRGKAPDYSTFKIQWDTARKRAGVEDARPHDLRAVALTAAKKQKLNPTALAGHSSPAMTERYLRDRDTPLVDAPSFRQSIDNGKKSS